VIAGNRWIGYPAEPKISFYFFFHVPTSPFTFRRAPLGSTKVNLINKSLTDGAAEDKHRKVDACGADAAFAVVKALRATSRNMIYYE